MNISFLEQYDYIKYVWRTKIRIIRRSTVLVDEMMSNDIQRRKLSLGKLTVFIDKSMTSGITNAIIHISVLMT